MTERSESERAELVALDPLEMLLDAARYAEGNGGSGSNPAWAKAARAAVAKARLAAPPDSGAGKSEPNDDWRDDPSADERWNAGLDFAMQQLCKALDVDPAKVTWDAATETVDGDVQSVIWNILRTRFGEDWDPDAVLPDHGGADAGVGEYRPPTPQDDEHMKTASDWFSYGYQSGMEAERKWGGDRALSHQPAPVENTDSDPSADERWQAGLDFAMIQLCTVMGVDPHDVTWDAATEEVEGDVHAVIWNILRAKMGEDWKPAPVAADASAEAEEEEEFYEIGLRDGYEDAIQDLDIATGGDGEFKGSSIPGETVDVPAMRARIISRLSNASAEARLREAIVAADTNIVNAIHLADEFDFDDGHSSRINQIIDELKAALEALSTSPPHASDCDKQGEEPDADHTPHNFSDAGGDTCRYCGNVEDSPVHKRPSDRTADDLPAIRSANDWDKQGER